MSIYILDRTSNASDYILTKSVSNVKENLLLSVVKARITGLDSSSRYAVKIALINNITDITTVGNGATVTLRSTYYEVTGATSITVSNNDNSNVSFNLINNDDNNTLGSDITTGLTTYTTNVYDGSKLTITSMGTLIEYLYRKLNDNGIPIFNSEIEQISEPQFSEVTSITGLSVDASNGTIRIIPSLANGTYNYQIRTMVRNTLGSIINTVSITKATDSRFVTTITSPQSVSLLPISGTVSYPSISNDTITPYLSNGINVNNVTFTTSPSISGISINAQSGVITIVPNTLANGRHQFTVNVSNSSRYHDSIDVSIAITKATNGTLSIQSDPVSSHVSNSTYTIDATVTYPANVLAPVVSNRHIYYKKNTNDDIHNRHISNVKYMLHKNKRIINIKANHLDLLNQLHEIANFL